MERVEDAGATRSRFDERAARLAAAQHGVIARAQAVRLGATKDVIRHRLRTGRWERLAPDVFQLAGAPHSWRQDLISACLVWGGGGVISHRATAALWRLAGFEPGPIELTVPRNRRRAGPGIIHRHPLPRADVTTVEGIPVTTPARTLIDLAAVLPREAVEEAMDDALRRGMVSIPLLRRRLNAIGRPGRPGIALMRSLLDARDPSVGVPESVLERRLLRTLQQAGLPSPVLQYEIRTGDRLVAVVDFAYPDARLAIEADGYRWHSGRSRWDHDRARRNRLTLLGWRIIHVTWTDLTRRPAATIEAVRSALAAEHR
jgi:very-short-patch-repair endonuclease